MEGRLSLVKMHLVSFSRFVIVVVNVPFAAVP